MADEKTSSDYRQELRSRAEERLRAAQPESGNHENEELLKLVQELQLHRVELEVQNEELRRTQAELTHSRAEFADLYDFAPVGYLSLDPDGRILRANLTAAALLAAERDHLIGRIFLLQVAAEDREIFYNHFREVTRKQHRAACELRLVKKTGEIFHAGLESVPVRTPDGSILCRSSLLDISERKRLEEELIRIQKYEALELLAGGIAHDFNNLLTAMLGNISLARMHLEPEGQPAEKLARAERTALRARDLVQQLLMFSGRGIPSKEAWASGPLIKEAAELPLKSTGCPHELKLPADLWPVTVDRSQFEQVIQNLIINAGQAMPQEGTITVLADNLRLKEDELPGLAAGDYVRIAVEDQGPGIPTAIGSKIFDPYFSTKPGGSGLGLAVSHVIIEKFGGRLINAPRPGKGARFEIYLPAADHPSEKEKEQKAKAEAGLQVGQGRILVMDDNPSVREVAAALLDYLGYETELAADGQSALELFKKAREQGEPFAAVILDLIVPDGMGGKETMERLREVEPEVKAIVSSGYAKEPVVEHYEKYGFSGSLPKPYSLEQIGRVLHSILEKEEAT
jgi:two-component system, cell cycle sensor histidine kinase and response regulator CckA